jgi:hypothetical protein
MAEVEISPNRIQSPDGLIKDLENNIISICKRGFQEIDELRRFEPQDWITQDPKRAGVKSLPSLFVYVESLFPAVRTIGQATTANQNVQEIFIVSVQYVYSPLDSDESDDSLKTCQWYLYRHLLSNLNFNDVCRGTHSIMDIDSTPEYLDYKKYQALDNFVIRLQVGNLVNMSTARR